MNSLCQAPCTSDLGMALDGSAPIFHKVHVIDFISLSLSLTRDLHVNFGVLTLN